MTAIALISCGPSTTTVVPGDQGPSLADATMRLVSGNDQLGEVNAFLPLPAAVEVVDPSGAPIEGAAVVWRFDHGAGRIGSGPTAGTVAATTNASGQSSVQWQLGTTAGAQAARAELVLPAGLPEKTVALAAVGRPGPASGITVIPDTMTLAVGNSAQLLYQTTDAFGNEIQNPSVSWSSNDESVAEVGATGVVLAVGEGSAGVRVTDGNVQAEAAITVEDSAPSPEILFEDGFESPDFAAQGWYDFGPWVQSTTESHSGSGSLEFSFGAGAVSPVGVAGRHLFDESPTLYLSYWVKYSSNWVGSGISYNPHEFMVLTNEDGQFTGPAFTALTMYVEHVHETGGNVPVVSASDRRNIDQSAINQDLTGVTENRAANGCNGSADGYSGACWNAGANFWNEKTFSAAQPYFTDAPGPAYKNDWHQVEVYIELNSIQGGVGQNDGVIRYWFDGELAVDHDDVLLRTGAHPGMAFNQLMIAPYIEAGSPVAQTLWIDDLEIGTARPSGP
ncbi:MAG: Ig-like domain-containing protein [Gemmatimonadota bacterium]|nr:Ig-like domain-containing protein [Gemmatimonadota bacterium]